jgi:TonB family protein
LIFRHYKIGVQSSGSDMPKNIENLPDGGMQTAEGVSVKSHKPGEMKLPREFRKGLLADFDKRFFLILLISLVVHIIGIEYLMNHLKKQVSPEYFSQLQQKFAHLLVEREPLPRLEPLPPSEPILVPAGTPITGVSSGTGESGGATGPPMPVVPLALATPETRGPTAEEVASSVRGGEAARVGVMESMEAGVGNVGLLAIITGGTGVLGDIDVNDVLAYGETSDQELRETLSQYDALKVSRGTGGVGQAGRDPTGQRVIRGQRRETSTLTVTDLVGEVPPLGEARVSQISRDERFERLTSTIVERPEVPKTMEEKRRLRRKPEFVQAVLQRHNLAITDCYKTRAKLQADLKGKVVVRFAIDPDGRVSDAQILESTFENPEIENCIVMRIRRWNDFGYGDPTAEDEVYRQVYTFGY